MNRPLLQRAFTLVAVCLLTAPLHAQSQPESFFYGADWRFLRSGEVSLSFTPGHGAALDLKTVGLVSTLVPVLDLYRASFAPGFCATSLHLDAKEGRKHRETQVTFDSSNQRATFIEKDLKTNRTLSTKEMEIPRCVHEVTGALQRLRQLFPQPGATIEIPVSDGKRLISARVDSLAREKVKTPIGEFNTVKFEAFLFNGQLYRRKGRLFVWLTDDERRLPVQIKIQLPFYIGTVTLQVEKHQAAN